MNTTKTSRIDLGLLVLRVIVGGVMIPHGAQKLFQFGISGTTQGFSQMGIPLPGVAAPLVCLVEFLGGLAIVIGLLTRLAALGLVFDMVGAIFFVHLANGFFNPKGFEFPLTLAAVYLTLIISGPGAYSLDAMIARRRAGTA